MDITDNDNDKEQPEQSNQLEKQSDPSNGDPDGSKDESSSPFEPELLKKLPPKDRQKVVELLSLQAISAPVFHPVTKKITEQHIDKLLDAAEKDSERSHEEARSSRRYGFAAFLVLVLLFVFVTMFLTSVDRDLYRDVVKVLLGVIGGFGGGFAFKSYLTSKDDD